MSLKINSWCNYISCDWIYCGTEDSGIRLKSPNKHLADVLVPHHRRRMIKMGKYQSGRR